MTRATFHSSFKVKRSKVRVTGRLTQTHKMCHIFRLVRPKNFKVGVWMEVVNSHQCQALWPLKVKGEGHMVCLTHVGHTVEFALGTLTKYSDARDWQSRWPPRSEVKVISLHRLYVSSLPLLNLGNKMLYLCH